MNPLRNPVMVAVIGAALFGGGLAVRTGIVRLDDANMATSTPPVPTLKERQEKRDLDAAFSALPLEATAVEVWDAQEGRSIFEKNSFAQLPLASLTKVMLVYTANQVLSPDVIVTIAPSDLAEEGTSGLSAGERFRFEDLRAATLVASINDGANAIARAAGETLAKGQGDGRAKEATVEKMNREAMRLDLPQTTFFNEDGLDLGPNQPGALGSARDLAKVFAALLAENPKSLEPTTRDGYLLVSQAGQRYQYWNTNQRLSEIRGILGSKTGYTTLADGNLAVAVSYDGRTYVIVVLGSSKEGRFDDVKRIADFLSSHRIPLHAESREGQSPVGLDAPRSSGV